MEKVISMSLRRLAILVVLSLPAAKPMLCQKSDSTIDLLMEAIRSGALESEGMPAFHVEGRFSTTNFAGEPASAGTVSIDYLKPGFSKVAFTSQTAPGKKIDPIESNDLTNSFMQQLLVRSFLHPGPTEADRNSALFEEKNRQLGPISLRCIQLTRIEGKADPQFGLPQVYCLAADLPLIRVAEGRYRFEVRYNSIVRFSGHTLAKELSIVQNGKTRADLSITLVRNAPELTEQNFSNAVPHVPVDLVFAKDSTVADTGSLLRKKDAVYPLDSRLNRLVGPWCSV